MSEQTHSDTETGFGTGLRAKLGRSPEGETAVQAPAVAADESSAPPLPKANGVPDADVEALRGELAAALARERDLQTAVADLEATARNRMADLQVDTSGRSAELDERAARLAAAEAEIEERERRVTEQLTMVRTEKERLSELENRVVAQDTLSTEREAQVEARMELAAYELLGRVAERVGDDETVQLAKTIRDQEQAMAERLASNFDRSVAASLEDVGREDMLEQLRKYLADAHAIEAQAIKLLEKGPELASDPELASLFEEHLVETRDQQELVDARLDALGGEPSMLKDLALKAGAINWGTFFAAHPDTPGKLVAFAYAFEHLEIAGYEHLRRVAEQAGDGETADAAARILEQERNAAEKLAAAFDRAVEASLRAQGVTA